MNSFIIHAIRRRTELVETKKPESNQQDTQQKSKVRNTEAQVFIILILVTFGFLTLTTPAYCLFLYIMLFDFTKTPGRFAGYNLFFHIAQKLDYTNNAVNFFLYVLSGTKFRADVKLLFGCGTKSNEVPNATSMSSISNWPFVRKAPGHTIGFAQKLYETILNKTQEKIKHFPKNTNCFIPKF